MQTNRSPLWALGGAAVGFMLPFVGLACIAAACLFSLAGASGLASTGATQSETHVSGPQSGPAVAVIDIDGEIVSGSSGTIGLGSSYAVSGDILPLVRQAASDSDVKAILLRINSPGGSVVASDEIYHALKGCGKPIVVSMGELDASGGFYISMAAQYLVANPNTLTGSIGVISEFPEASQLMKNLGITVAVIKSGAVKDMGSMYRPMTDDEKAIWQQVIDETYGSFVQIVADGRHLSMDQVLALADGRVFTGRQALALGLVDALGYEEDALAKAAALGGIKGTPRVIHLAPPALSIVSALLSGQFSQSLLPENFFSDLLAPKLEYRWTGQ
jgi:protease-4